MVEGAQIDLGNISRRSTPLFQSAKSTISEQENQTCELDAVSDETVSGAPEDATGQDGSESDSEAYRGLSEAETIQRDRQNLFLGPEYHHVFDERLDPVVEKTTEYEESWTDTFYDLLIVAVMSKVTRLMLQGIVTFYATTSGVQNFRSIWHFGTVVAFCLVFYALWRSLLLVQMFLRSNRREDTFTMVFLIIQMILAVFMIIGLYHLEPCPGLDALNVEIPEGHMGHTSLEEQTCVVFGVPWFGACVSFAFLLVGLFHVLMAFHPKPELCLRDEDFIGKLEVVDGSTDVHKLSIAKHIQKVTRRQQLGLGLIRFCWSIAGLIHWTAIDRNNAMGITLCYTTAFVVDTVLYAGAFNDRLQSFSRKVRSNPPHNTSGPLRWSTPEVLTGLRGHFKLPIHTRFYIGRHKSLIAIAYGESILQLTGASNTLIWKPTSESICCTLLGLLIVYSLASVYFHSLNNCSTRDHPVSVGCMPGVFWGLLQPLVIVSLAAAGAGYEALWGYLALDFYEDHTSSTFGGVEFSYATFANAMICCLLNGMGQDWQRIMAYYRWLGVFLCGIVPFASCCAIMIPVQFKSFNGWNNFRDQMALIMGLVAWSSIYQVRLMGWLVYDFVGCGVKDLVSTTNPKCSLEECDFEIECLKEQLTRLKIKLEQRELERQTQMYTIAELHRSKSSVDLKATLYESGDDDNLYTLENDESSGQLQSVPEMQTQNLKYGAEIVV